jgi:CRISPR-associated protein Cas2
MGKRAGIGRWEGSKRKGKFKTTYVFLMYDIADQETEAGKNRVTKVFKICKRYLIPYQKSVFRGEITPSRLLKLKIELAQVIDPQVDFISIIQFGSEESFLEESLGTPPSSLFI